MQTKLFEFRTKIMAGQIRKNGDLSFSQIYLHTFFEGKAATMHLSMIRKMKLFDVLGYESVIRGKTSAWIYVHIANIPCSQILEGLQNEVSCQ